jgi:hypothetical protein
LNTFSVNRKIIKSPVVILYQSESLKTSLAICIDQKQKDKKNKNGKGQNIPPMFLLGQVIGSNF